MSFFRKLKDRMFKSSSRLDEGLDAIIEEGAEEVDDQREPEVEPAPHRARMPEPEPEPALPVETDIPAQFHEPEP
jgi:fused signal recognition particle receptor